VSESKGKRVVEGGPGLGTVPSEMAEVEVACPPAQGTVLLNNWHSDLRALQTQQVPEGS
jgi:hypothetical protein